MGLNRSQDLKFEAAVALEWLYRLMSDIMKRSRCRIAVPTLTAVRESSSEVLLAVAEASGLLIILRRLVLRGVRMAEEGLFW